MSLPRTPPFITRLAAVFGSALVLMFFSEFYFVNEGPTITLLAASPLRGAAGLLEFALYYALFAYVLLLALAHYEVRSWNGLFLAGVLFGWATEAVIVPVAYEAVPISLIFPSVSWHALVDVLLGWYAVRVIMRRRGWASALMFIVLGAVWAAWATWFWVEPDALSPLTPGSFFNFALITALAWIVGMVLLDAAAGAPFQPPKWEVRAVLAVTLLLAIAMAVPFLPFSLALPPLVVLVLLALRRGAGRGTENVLAPLQHSRPAWWQYPLTLLTPLTAAVVYPLFYEAGTGIPTEDITFLLLVVGTLLLLVALVRALTRPIAARIPASPDRE
jgi:hypothetical protein